MKTFTSVKDILVTAQKDADHFFTVYPDLLGLREDRATLQVKLEKYFSKTSKSEHLLQTKFGSWVFNLSEMDKRSMSKEEVEKTERDFKALKLVLSHLPLSKRISLPVMHSMMYPIYKDIDEMHQFWRDLIESGLVLFDERSQCFMVKDEYDLEPDEEAILEFFQSNIAMVVEPKRVRVGKNQKSPRNGYATIKRSIWSGKADEHKEVPLDFLNIQNRIPYVLNYDAWDKFLSMAYVDPKRDDEDTDDVYSRVCALARLAHYKKALILNVYRRLGINIIYIPNMYDYRGRNYPIAYLINPQGTDSDKALLKLEPRELTEEGKYWLKISIANCFNCKHLGKDLDKLRFDERYEWFQSALEPLMRLPEVEFYERLEDLALEAESPGCFWSQMDDLYKANQAIRDNLTPYTSAITHFDATCSGYQLQSIFARDWVVAERTNVVPNAEGLRNCFYTISFSELKALGLPPTFTRSFLKKKVFIPAVYNSTTCLKHLEGYEELFNEYMGQFAMWRLNRNLPLLWDTTTYDYSWYLPDGFRVYHVIRDTQENVEFSFENMSYILNRTVTRKEDPTIKHFSAELGPNMTHSCDGFLAREIARRMSTPRKHIAWVRWLRQHPEQWKPKNNPSRSRMEKLLNLGKYFNFYSFAIVNEVTPNNIDLVPEEVWNQLFAYLPEKECAVSEIHDSFGVPPNYAGELMQQYRYLLHLLAKSRFLGAVVEQYLCSIGTCSDEDIHTWLSTFDLPVDDEFAEAILQSTYALC